MVVLYAPGRHRPAGGRADLGRPVGRCRRRPPDRLDEAGKCRRLPGGSCPDRGQASDGLDRQVHRRQGLGQGTDRCRARSLLLLPEGAYEASRLASECHLRRRRSARELGSRRQVAGRNRAYAQGRDAGRGRHAQGLRGHRAGRSRVRCRRGDPGDAYARDRPISLEISRRCRRSSWRARTRRHRI